MPETTWKPLVEGRPRIHLGPVSIAELKNRAETTHAFYYERLLAAADSFAGERVPQTMGVGDDHRSFGDKLSTLAMAFLLTEDEKHLDQVRRFVAPMVAAESWQGGIGLVTGHLMAGVATAYDWLYDYLEIRERDEMRDAMLRNARLTYKLASEQRVWWHDYFLVNWCHVPTATLAYAAAALAGETDETRDWMKHADFVFSMAAECLADDGSCEEGQAYMVYSWEWFQRYFDIARDVFGKDHWDCGWLRNAPYMILHATTPRAVFHDSCMVFGDGRRHCEWNGPVHLLQRSAGEYRDGVIQGFAGWLAERGVGIDGASTWLNMLWYDPTVEKEDFRNQPTARLFGELGTMYARSGWDEDAMLVGFKCTSSTTDHVREAFPGRPIAGGHCHPDAASFQVYAFGEWMAVDPGYTLMTHTQNHNTVMINGKGQLGGDKMWFDSREAMLAEGVTITDFESTDAFAYARADASAIYRPAARLKRFIRHLVYLKPYDLIIVDELEAEVKSNFEWLVHAENTISADGNVFSFELNGVKCRVTWLAPEDFQAKVRRQRIAWHPPEGLEEMDGLWIGPREKTRATTFASLLSFYKTDAPTTSLESFALDESVVTIGLTRDGTSQTVTLDMEAASVSVK